MFLLLSAIGRARPDRCLKPMPLRGLADSGDRGAVKVIAILMAVAVALTSCSSPEFDTTGKECWRHVRDVPDKPGNVTVVCKSGADGSLQVYFPNSWLRLMPPTTCNSSGSVTEAGEGLTFQFGAGACENGRALKPQIFECQRAGSSLSCRVEGSELVFQHFPGNP